MSSRSPSPVEANARPIRADERSGVLHPGNLARYAARWFAPDPSAAPVVDQYWHVRWRLAPGETIEQRILELPAVTLSIETGDVPLPLLVTGVQRRAWTREIAGSGSVFGIRLRPAGLAVLGDLPPDAVADAAVELTPERCPRLHALVSDVAAVAEPAARARAADAAVRAALADRPPSREGLLANAVVDELVRGVRSRTGRELAELFGVSERTVQRALRSTVGKGPKWISRRVRLQEVARALAAQPELDLARLAAELGYVDQAHLARDFTEVAGTTPAAYRRSLRT